jgi:hypothetical protein
MYSCSEPVSVHILVVHNVMILPLKAAEWMYMRVVENIYATGAA